MNKETFSLQHLNATRITAATVGVVMGIFSGLNHGFFEILQGNIPTNGLVFDAIGDAQKFWPGGGEPALSLIPNFMLTGILSMVVGLAIVVWSLWFLPTRHGASVYLGLFILLFLVGGGIGQVFFFLPAWAFATRMDKPLTWWRKVLPRSTWTFLSRLWLILLVMATFLMLLGVEMAIFGIFPGITDQETFENTNMLIILGSAILYVLSFIAGFGHELQRMENENQSAAPAPAAKEMAHA